MPANRTNVFISYSRKDVKWLERLKVFLAPVKAKQHEIILWDDTAIKPGSNWQDEIDNALASCKIAVLLISANFFDSNFIKFVELPALMDAVKKEEATILPLILGPSYYERSDLSTFQAFNDLNEPLIDLSKSEKDKILNNISFLIDDVLTSISKTAEKSISDMEDFSRQNSPEEYLTKTLTEKYGETRFLAEFVLDENGTPRCYTSKNRRDYKVRMFIKDAPPDAQKVVYTLHETYINPIRFVQKGVREFELNTTTYGDYEVKILIPRAEGEMAMKLWLSTALENFYGDNPGEEIFAAIKYLQEN